MGLIIISLTTLYDEYIDEPKLSEQKNRVQCIVPPLKRDRNKYRFKTDEKCHKLTFKNIGQPANSEMLRKLKCRCKFASV